MDILRSLAPPAPEVRRETVVNNLTPTLIADNYMESKINSVRMAQLRGYEVPASELDLIEAIAASSRDEQHRLFKEYYTEDDYLPLPSLSSSYPLSATGGKVKGPQRSHLAFIFYASDGVDINGIDLEDDTEVVIIGLYPVPFKATEELLDVLRPRRSVLIQRLTSDMSLWPLSNPLVSDMVLHKQGFGLGDLAAQRGVPDLTHLPKMKMSDIVAVCFGAEPGDIMMETRISSDATSLVARNAYVRYIK